ncbi:hypothetical protein BOW53_00335 [Solemya pervernicosa gill symbiont]|uniref:diguanylate cyclase n=2 Tax=Gammaproteobacteria incertae sedis TaxID=118884 RepID=A0A1T2LBB5_9GAMM|nr:diguanylate cyclase [Candidatus Reidiella endopervernicosa]OOZ42324.1 hypothetical protein BOW53_00335 [Solemya pervernicosa gill symbiont]QKQ25720.1 diguanylate cyclase [Candidatus Reidiella endopervernicosa]
MSETTRILVVDGSEVSRTIISRSLNDQLDDADITVCANAAEANQQLQQAEFDLITTSLMLPDIDGLELCRQIRGSDKHRFTPLIVISGDADGRLLREGFAAGVTDYYDKSRGYSGFAQFIKRFTHRQSRLEGHALYVEDSATAAAVNGQMMQRHGLRITQVESAEGAFELLKECLPGGPRYRDPFDIVITDFFLKGSMTGGDLLHAIRTRFNLSQQEMPVLVITGSTSDERQVEVFHAGANDFVSKPIVEEILMARLRSLLLIKQQFSALRRQAEKLHHLAITDMLTGVRNKRYLLDNGEDFLNNQRNQPLWAMLLDIDHFKQINDTLGHITGDRVLEALGTLLLQSFPKDSMVVRFGGEEFAVLIPNCSREEAVARAETLRLAVERLRPVDIEITASIGICSTLDHPDQSLSKFLSLADKALYEAKSRGRNQCCIYTQQGIEAITLSVNTPPTLDARGGTS